MTGKDDEAVDSSWGSDEDEPDSTRAVDSQKLLAAAGLLRGASEAEKAATRRVFERETMPPPGPPPSSDASSGRPSGRVTSIPESPKVGPARGIGRRNTPIVSDAPLRARTLDATAKHKLRAPSVVTPVHVQAVVAPGGGSSLRFGSEVELDEKRDRSRSTTPRAGAAYAAAPLSPRAPAVQANPARDPLPTLVEWVDTGSVEVEELALSEDDVAALSLELDDVAAELDAGEGGAGDDELDPALEPVRKHFDRGDFLGASLRAELLLQDRPELAAARRYLEQSQSRLRQMYLDKLGSGAMVLRLAMRPDEIQGLSLDNRAGFLFSLIDGAATIDEVLDMCSMPQLEALRLLYDMQQQGVVVADSTQQR